jgi:hypothetical protein
MALPVARWKNQQFLLFLDRFRMTCCEARHWISVLHSDGQDSPTLYESVCCMKMMARVV